MPHYSYLSESTGLRIAALPTLITIVSIVAVIIISAARSKMPGFDFNEIIPDAVEQHH